MKKSNSNNSLEISEPFLRHEGIVSKISNDTITISLKGDINCEGCKAKSACGVSESNDKEIEVDNTSKTLQLNENVEVVLQKDLGLKAVFWAYVLPFILMVSILLIASLYLTEWQAGLLALAILVPYYFSLHYLNAFFKKRFKVSILKMT
ncbi:MAG: SoxR reducing system RseC family protein [Flavobacteriaceae bacterium]|nr:SoxR reducing system RseC family protein [Flavobacteriaceae bacterium]